MSNMKDSCFRLFGRNIQAPKVYNHDNYCDCESISSSNNSKNDENRANYEKAARRDVPRNRSQSIVTADTKIASNGKGNSYQDSHNQDISYETSSTKSTNKKYRNLFKKPDKILACPRCKSMATKFCYFNNYNVNQPRHFCKDCQRYWTAGGTMRSIPVGAGRRKKKSSNNSMFSENEINFRVPYTWNPVAWQTGFPNPTSFYSLTPSSSPSCSSSRKYSRDDGTMLFFGKSDSDGNEATNDVMKSGYGRVVRAKTMKLDDPMEVANSSIGNTLAVKNNRHVSINPMTKTQTRSFGIPQQQYNGHGVHDSRNNPAAYSRSLLFQ